MRGFIKHGATTIVINVMTLALGLLTGIIAARTLGPDGRGALTAVLTAPQVLGWLFTMGCAKAVTFHLSRDATLGARLLSTWLVLFIPVGAIAVTTGEILLPSLFSAQSVETLQLARTLHADDRRCFALGFDLLGIVLGDQDFLYFNTLNFIQPAGAAIVYVLLWLSGYFTVSNALVTQVVLGLVVLMAATGHVVHRHGIAWPDLDLGRRTFWYALRAHGEIISGTLTRRLDLLIIPAFLTASSVGLYAVATSVSGIIASIAGSIATILLPAATRLGESGRRLVIKSLHATLLMGMVLGGGLFLFANSAIRTVYGAEFSESVLPLRILLPGAVLSAGASILLNGLYAENRPFTATIASALGTAVTVAGLLTFLGTGGILAAAIVWTAAFALVFAVAGILYWRATGLEWQAFAPQASDVQAMLQRLLAILHLGPRDVSADVSAQKAGE